MPRAGDSKKAISISQHRAGDEEMRYQFVQEEGQFRRTILLRMLGVCAGAFYYWQKRPISRRARHKELLVTQICELFHASKARYGSPRIHQDLQALGIQCSQKRVAQLMKEQNLVVRKARRFVKPPIRAMLYLLHKTC